jgi:hypothetical protein
LFGQVEVVSDFGDEVEVFDLGQGAQAGDESFVAGFGFGVEVDEDDGFSFEFTEAPAGPAESFGPDVEAELGAGLQDHRQFIFYIQNLFSGSREFAACADKETNI